MNGAIRFILIPPFQEDVRNMFHTVAALRVQPPTMVAVVRDLVREHWAIKRRSVQDRRAFGAPASVTDEAPADDSAGCDGQVE